MPRRKADLLRGTLDLLVMKAVSPEALHGVGIARRLEQITKGTFGVSYGSLFPACTEWRKRGGSRLSGASRRTTAGPSTTS